jgi:hypothetical protein
VWGYFKLACICCTANILAGTLVCVRSAHDDVRRGCAALFRGAGLRISRLGTAAAAAAPDAAAAAGALSLPVAADSGKGGSDGGSRLHGQEAAVERYLAGIQKYIDSRVAECAEAAALGSDGSEGSADATALDPQTGLLPMPAGARDADLELLWAAMEISMKTVSEGRGWRASWRQLCAVPAHHGIAQMLLQNTHAPPSVPACTPPACPADAD